ncbi:ribbon-helix-helix protein, CopG family [Saccharolobus solfataricus]
MDVISFKLPPALNQRLETYATKRKMTKSEVIRLALNEYLAKEGV